jgi:hypothetical protein
MMATQLAVIGGGLAPSPTAPDMDTSSLAMFTSIPPRHGVAVMQGLVAVYDEEILHREGLIEGGFYVVEYQRPRACMSWTAYHEDRLRRLDTSREVVRVERSNRSPDLWMMRHAQSMWVSGPLHDINLGDMIVGRVVGIYRPSEMGEA